MASPAQSTSAALSIVASNANNATVTAQWDVGLVLPRGQGPGDRLRSEQMSKFEALATVSGKPVRLLHLKATADAGHTPAGMAVPP